MLAQIRGGGLEAYWTESEVYRCADGNQALAFALEREIGAERIRTRAPAARVETTGEGVRVWIGDASAEESDPLEGDLVVCTLPPPVWSQVRFEPPLPADLAPQMGRSVKLLSRVRRRVWSEQGLSQYAFSDGLVPMTWEATDRQEGPGDLVLTTFASHDAADHWRALSKEARASELPRAVDAIYPGFADAFVDLRFMDWPSDPLVGGGYSFPAPGQVLRDGPRLYDGLGRLRFAGEHTCYKFVGYMEGGLASGAELARRITA
jgi:monoamine oxidase